MDIKELKINHVVQIKEDKKCPIVCSIINIGEDSVDVEIIGKDDGTEMRNQVPIGLILPVDILECHILSLGFKRQDPCNYDLLGWNVYLWVKNGREVLIAKTDDRFHLLKWDGKECKYIATPPLLTLHNLQSEMYMNLDEIEKVDKDTLKQLSQRYQVTILTPTVN